MRAKGVFAGSYTTSAEPISTRLTWTPSSFWRAFSTRATQCPQLMPSILMLRCSMDSSPLHRPEQYTPPPYSVKEMTLSCQVYNGSQGSLSISQLQFGAGLIYYRPIQLRM